MPNYKFIIAPVLGWVVAQGIKLIISLRKDGIDWKDALQSGGMPSSHAAFMVSICTVIALSLGLSSVEFGIITAVTAVILYDSIGVRKTTGDQTDAINELAKNNHKKLLVKISISRGHNLIEVIAGAFVGVLVGLLTSVLLT
jgi:hypothetical protein